MDVPWGVLQVLCGAGAIYGCSTRQLLSNDPSAQPCVKRSRHCSRYLTVRPQVGDRVSVDAVAHQEGSYRWRVTRLQLESEALAVAAKAAAAMAMQQQRGASRYGQRTGARPAGRCLLPDRRVAVRAVSN